MLPVKIDRYFFVHQEVVAHPTHDQTKPHTHSNSLNVNINTEQLGPQVVVAECEVYSNDEESENPRYSYRMVAIGYFPVIEEEQPNIGTEDFVRKVTNLATQCLAGAMRERLCDMTARGPWGPLMMDFFPMPSVSVNYSDQEQDSSKD